MFYCDKCRDENGWPAGNIFSRGRCEMCGEVASCHDVPSGRLPPPKLEGGQSTATAPEWAALAKQVAAELTERKLWGRMSGALWAGDAGPGLVLADDFVLDDGALLDFGVAATAGCLLGLLIEETGKLSEKIGFNLGVETETDPRCGSSPLYGVEIYDNEEDAEEASGHAFRFVDRVFAAAVAKVLLVVWAAAASPQDLERRKAR